MQRAKRAEDADKVLDELLNKYGKVVYTNYEARKPVAPSPSPLIDDDSDSLSRMLFLYVFLLLPLLLFCVHVLIIMVLF